MAAFAPQQRKGRQTRRPIGRRQPEETVPVGTDRHRLEPPSSRRIGLRVGGERRIGSERHRAPAPRGNVENGAVDAPGRADHAGMHPQHRLGRPGADVEQGPDRFEDRGRRPHHDRRRSLPGRRGEPQTPLDEIEPSLTRFGAEDADHRLTGDRQRRPVAESGGHPGIARP